MKLGRPLYLAIMLAGILGLGLPVSSEPISVGHYSKPICVACVGDSITSGYGVGTEWSYPSQLSRMLGKKWDILNFGTSGATMLKKSDKPYMSAYPLQSKPDVVIIALGTNDVKPQNWNQEAYVSDYQEMIDAFHGLRSKPVIYLCLPLPVTPPGSFSIPPDGPAKLISLIRPLAEKNHCDLIDFNTPIDSHPEWLSDHVHPNREGAFAMAKAAYAVLTGADYQGDMLPPAPPPASPAVPATK